MEDQSYRSLMDYAMRALGRRAHTEYELRRKIKKRPHRTEKLENQVLARLIDLNLINDEELIRRIISDAVNCRFHGRMNVMKRLRIKGIPIDKTKRIWDSMGIVEQEVAENALKRARKRFMKVPKEKLYNKRAQFLASRGFPAEIVFNLAKAREEV